MSKGDNIGAKSLEAFEAILDFPPGEHEAQIAARCGGADSALAQAVRRLLTLDENATRMMRTVPEVQGDLTVARPERIGPYRLGELLGVGGMGSVYRGERDDGVFDQTVAIKLIRSALMLSPSVQARFADERRILARLRHRAIAQIFDGGTDSTGLSWLVMEYVEGVPIDAYAQRIDDTATVVNLLARLCDAVHFAHQNLVVHADIKPGNVLVTRGGDLKLLDFGISRLLAGSTDASAELAAGTHIGAGPLTHAFAAPERIAGAEPTVFGDIYGLGVLIDKVLQPATTRYASEFQSVVTKATALDPANRYESAAALAEDLRRVQLHRPLVAHEPGSAYTAQLFIRRNRIAVALITLAAVSIVGATILSTILFFRAERQRTQAEQRFGEVRELAHYMLFDLYDGLERVPGSTALRREIARRGSEYLSRLRGSSGAADLRLETGVGLTRLSRVLGLPQQPNLGEHREAIATLDRAIEELNALPAENARGQTGLAEALLTRARMAISVEHDGKTADGLIKRASAILGPLHIPIRWQGDRDESRRVVDLLRLQTVAEYADWTDQPQVVVTASKEAIAFLKQWPTDSQQDEHYAHSLAVANRRLGDGIYYTGDIAGSLSHYREALAITEAAMRRLPQRPRLISEWVADTWSIGTTQANMNQMPAALATLNKAFEPLRQLEAFDLDDNLIRRQRRVVENARAEVLSSLGRHAEAVKALETAIENSQRLAEVSPEDAFLARDYAITFMPLGVAYANAGRQREACSVWRQGRELLDSLRQKERLNASDIKEHLGNLEHRLTKCP
jgi:eukaryotic-like serine/threonine-protein kinase